jgi:hypothetical protein
MLQAGSFEEALALALRSIVRVLPKVTASLIVAIILIIISVIVIKVVSRLLRASGIDTILAPYFKKYNVPFTVTSLINSILALGLLLVVLYSSIIAGFPEYKNYAVETIDIIARVASVFYMIILVYVALNYVTDKLRMESGLGGYMALIIFNIVLILLIDVTALSPVVKQALSWGLSLGLGLSVAVFTAWYFFGQESPMRSRRKEGNTKG